MYCVPWLKAMQFKAAAHTRTVDKTSPLSTLSTSKLPAVVPTTSALPYGWNANEIHSNSTATFQISFCFRHKIIALSMPAVANSSSSGCTAGKKYANKQQYSYEQNEAPKKRSLYCVVNDSLYTTHHQNHELCNISFILWMNEWKLCYITLSIRTLWLNRKHMFMLT